MNNIEPSNQTRLFGLNRFIDELINLYEKNKLPNKILLSGQKGSGKSTLAYHFINYVLSKNEDLKYNLQNYKINPENHSFKTILNRSNPNFNLIDIKNEKKSIDIAQIRDLIVKLNKSSFNNKPRFVLVDNIEFLNINSINTLLKILEEPSTNVHFILVHNNKKILPTLLSRCLDFKISISNKESLEIADKLLDGNLFKLINKDLINYYSTPGNIYNIASFGVNNKYDLNNFSLKKLLQTIITNKHYKKDSSISFLVFDFIEFYFNKMSFSLTTKINDKYSYFLKRISDTKKFNLDEESLFLEFEDKILNE
tara:strand:- start:15 stop:947 length:933 start_codon:yes stop_codon:yes gene_type:complete